MITDYIDISPEISGATAVFPGDQPFERRIAMDFKTGHHLLLSEIRTTVHIGAHADAPNHYHPDGAAIHERELGAYFGPCQVIEVRIPPGERIRPAHLSGKIIQAPRVLIKTGSYPDPQKWNQDFNSLSPELIQWLAAQDVILVGLDTPSVDPFDSKELEAHQAIYAADLAILEGIILDQATEGLYDLIALPLRIQGADASPVRAVLLPKGRFSS